MVIRRSDVPDELQRVERCGGEPGPGKATWYGADRWAPALQRTVEGTLRCVRGTRMEFGARSLLLVIARSSCDEAIQLSLWKDSGLLPSSPKASADKSLRSQ